MFFEATSMAPDVKELLMAAVEPGPYLPERQTLWPRSARLRIRFDPSVLAELAALAEQHAEPELFDHLFVYSDGTALLEYPDALLDGSRLYVTSIIPEEKLRSWADKNHLDLLWRAV